MTEPTIAELYELVRSLHAKIDKLTAVQTNATQLSKPEYNLVDWIKQCVVSKEHLTAVFENRHIEAFQQCVSDNCQTCPAPIAYINKAVFVYDDTNAWTKLSDEHLRVLIRDIWRRFVFYNLNTPSEAEDEIQDLNRRLIIDMRRVLYDVRKNRAELMRWVKAENQRLSPVGATVVSEAHFPAPLP